MGIIQLQTPDKLMSTEIQIHIQAQQNFMKQVVIQTKVNLSAA